MSQTPITLPALAGAVYLDPVGRAEHAPGIAPIGGENSGTDSGANGRANDRVNGGANSPVNGGANSLANSGANGPTGAGATVRPWTPQSINERETGFAIQPDDTVTAALNWGIELGLAGLVPGSGATAQLWQTLATVASDDLGAARAIEPHLDALAILAQACEAGLATDAGTDPVRTWGVFASEGGPDPLTAEFLADGWQLTGTKQWCSLADRLDAALVSATTEDGSRRLFSVNLADPGVLVEPGTWVSRGLTEIPSGPVRFLAVSADAVGEPGWYLERPGFSWGGIGVAACWYGGAVGLARTLFAAAITANSAGKADPFRSMHLGVVDEALGSARRALAEAATMVDAGLVTGAAGRLTAKRVRSTVARACETVLSSVAHALGPAPLALDATHAKRVADLELYLRQHHAERDDASLGDALVRDGAARGGVAPW